MITRATLHSVRLSLLILGLGSPLLSGQTFVGFENFSTGNGQYSVVNTNQPGGPWSYNAALTTWSCFDMDPCGAVAFRASRLNSPVLTVVTPGILTLTFTHRYSFEPFDGTYWDGGQLRLSVNGGPYEEVPLVDFVANGYNANIGGANTPNNELLGLDVFGDASPGYATTNFTTSIVSLGPFAVDDTVSIQFLGAWDDCVQGAVPNWEINSVDFNPALEDRKVAPSFPNPNLPADTAVIQGIDAVFTIEVDGIPAPAIQWYRNGNPVFGGTNSTLVIPTSIPFLASGNYFVRASNTAGTNDSRTAVLTVTPDTFPPNLLHGVVRLDELVVLSFDETMDSNVFDSFSVFLYETGADPFSTALGVASATLENDTNWVMSLLDPLPQGVNLSVFIGDLSLSDIFGNRTTPTLERQLRLEVVVLSIDDNPSWRYNSSGGDFFTTSPAFFEAGFDDSAWLSGAALLGTETSATPEPIRTPIASTSGGGPITSYYRTRFVLPVALAEVFSLRMRTVIDDGAVSYLNGQEVFRVRVDAGQGAATLASRSVGDGVYEGPFAIDISALADGENVLATDLHQVTTGSSDNLWGAELVAVVSGIVQTPVTILTQPGPGPIDLLEYEVFSLSVLAGGTPPITYQWNLDGSPIPSAVNATYLVAVPHPSDQGTYTVELSNAFGSVTSNPVVVNIAGDPEPPTIVDAISSFDLVTITVRFSEPPSDATATNLAHYTVTPTAGGANVAVLNASLNGTTVTLTTEPRGFDNYTLTVRDIIDLAETPNLLAPNPTVLALPSEVIVLDTGANDTWRYNDSGEDLGSAWSQPAFIDTTWPVGAPLFYLKIGAPGVLEVPQRTTLSSTNASGSTNDLGTQRVVTYYFRTTFNFPFDPITTPVSLRYVLDDGAVFYINGDESLRVGMDPLNPITYTTLATRTEGNDQSFEPSASIDGSSLVQGDNLIAAELHQVMTSSSDAALALQILARVPMVTPTLRVTGVSIDLGGNVIIEHNGASVGGAVYVQETTELGPNGLPTSWTTVPGGPHGTPYNAGAPTGTRFFQVTDTP